MKRLLEVRPALNVVSPMVVACVECGMTMWATSKNAMTDGVYIFCTTCAGESQE